MIFKSALQWHTMKSKIGKGVWWAVYLLKKATYIISYEVLDSVNVIEGRAPLLTAHVSDWNVIDNPPASRLFVGVSIRTVGRGISG